MRKAGKTPLTPTLHKQTLAFAGAVLAQLPRLSETDQQNYIRNPKRLQKVLEKAFAEDLPKEEIPYWADLLRWKIVYHKLFGHDPDLSVIDIPSKPEGFGPMRLIVVAKEIIEWTGNRPLEGALEELEKHFPVWEYISDLDTSITTNDRDPKNHSYAVWVRDTCEADEEFAGQSANDLKEMGHSGITLLERQLLEADYFFEKGEHLDVVNATLCSGSRYSDGSVPSADWFDDRFRVNWFDPSDRLGDLRSRRVWA